MNKKTYQKPMMNVTNLAMETPLLAGSGNVNAVFDDEEIIDEGTVDARRQISLWD